LQLVAGASLAHRTARHCSPVVVPKAATAGGASGDARTGSTLYTPELGHAQNLEMPRVSKDGLTPTLVDHPPTPLTPPLSSPPPLPGLPSPPRSTRAPPPPAPPPPRLPPSEAVAESGLLQGGAAWHMKATHGPQEGFMSASFDCECGSCTHA